MSSIQSTGHSLDDAVQSVEPRRPFEIEAAEAFARVRRTMTDLLAALPGDIRRPKDLEHVLRLDYKLCWRLFSIVRSEESLAAVSHIPKPPSLDRLVKAARRLGVQAAVVGAMESAVRCFDEVVEAHAGDRADFDAMAAAVSLTEGAGEEIDPAQRRAAFRCNSHIWGIQLQTFGIACIVRPAASGEGTDECVLNSKIGLRRLRPRVSAIVHGFHHYSAKRLDAPPERQPLDQAAAALYGAPLLSDFCTQPMPTFRRIVREDGWTLHELDGNEIGRRSAVDLAFGGVARGVPFTQDVDGRRLFRSSVDFQTPTATLISDLLVHRPSFGAVGPELTIFKSGPGNVSPMASRRAQQLPIGGRVRALGRGTDVLQTPEMPRHADMVARAFAVLGWNAEEFDAYRVRITYPVLNSTAQLQFYLP